MENFQELKVNKSCSQKCAKVYYRIFSINRPGRLLHFWTLRVALIRGGRLFEAGRLLNFLHFQQVKYVYFATEQQKANNKTRRSNKARFL